MNWKKKRMIGRLDILHVILLVLAVILLLGLVAEFNAFAFTSPLTFPLVSPLPVMPKKPQGLENCPAKYIIYTSSVGYPVCVTWAVLEYNLDVEPKYIFACVLGYPWIGDLCKKKAPTPESVPTAVSTNVSEPVQQVVYDEVLMDILWMGSCRMWYSVAEGRVTRVSCP